MLSVSFSFLGRCLKILKEKGLNDCYFKENVMNRQSIIFYAFASCKFHRIFLIEEDQLRITQQAKHPADFKASG